MVATGRARFSTRAELESELVAFVEAQHADPRSPGCAGLEHEKWRLGGLIVVQSGLILLDNELIVVNSGK